MIPPEQDAEFVAAMENVLDVYERPADPRYPVVCVDELHTQLVGETRARVPPAPGRRERFDYEYERKGSANTSKRLRVALASESRLLIGCAVLSMPMACPGDEALGNPSQA